MSLKSFSETNEKRRVRISVLRKKKENEEQTNLEGFACRDKKNSDITDKLHSETGFCSVNS